MGIRLCFTLLLSCLVSVVLGQIKGIVTDKATGKPVPYANIWVENENEGTTSTEAGVFSFAGVSAMGKLLVVSCLGYEQSRTVIVPGEMNVQLQPRAIELQQVIVRPSGQRQKRVVSKLKHDVSPAHWYANGGVPWIVASFVPYSASYETTPFLDQISCILWSRADNAKFQIRLLEVGENGQPGKDLLPAPLIGTSPKGLKQELALEVSQFNLQIPKEGFFIAFEWFILPENAVEISYKKKGSKGKATWISYEPSILSQSEVTDGYIGWVYT